MQRSSATLVATLLALTSATSGCAARYESALRSDLARTRRALDPDEAPAPDGTLRGAVASALAQHPVLRAAHARWRAQTLRVESARQLPEPMIQYAFYASPVQTRVGPQRHRLSVRQRVPWPTSLSEAADAQAIRARGAQRRYEARALMLRAEVADAWWGWWALRAAHLEHLEHVAVLESLVEVLRARLAVSGATVGQLAQAELRLARMRDVIDSVREDATAARARLAAAVYAEAEGLSPPPPDVPPAALPEEPVAALMADLDAHPLLAELALEAEAHEANARAIEGRRFPSFELGLDWIETGEAMMPVQGSGDDAVIVMVGLSVPLWQGAYDDAQRAAEAEGAAALADRDAALAGAQAELTSALSRVRDTARRLQLNHSTLEPQARAALESLIGELAVGRASQAAVLLAQQDLFEVRLERVALRAEHGRAWARLERIVGRPVPAASPLVATEASR